MLDITVYDRLKPLDLSQFSNRFIERKRQIDEDTRKKRQEEAAAIQQQFQNNLATNRANIDAEQHLMSQQKWDEEVETLKQTRTEKRRNFLTQFLGDEAESLSLLPEDKRADYYKRVLLPGLEDSGFKIDELPTEYQPELIEGWRIRALPPVEREDLRVDREKRAIETQKKTMFDTWKNSMEPYLRSKNFKLKQEDVNRIMSTFPTDLAGYQPAEKFLDNLRLQPQPVPGLTVTPRQQFRDIMDLRKDFEDNLEVKALKIAKQKIDQINNTYNQYISKLQKGEDAPQFDDQVFAYNFNKMLDETSVVMPGEFQRITEGAGITQEVIAKIQQAISGGLKFTPEQRKELVTAANLLYAATKNRATNTYAQFNNEARLQGIDPYRITGSIQYIMEPGAQRPAGAGPNPPPKKTTTKSKKLYEDAEYSIEEVK